jgi:putative transposase
MVYPSADGLTRHVRDARGAFPAMSQVPLNGLSEAERNLAFERFELLCPALEEGVPLARVARDPGIPLRTAQRCAGQYRLEGLAGLARKERSDRGKRHLSDKLRQAIEGIALKKPPLSSAAIHRHAVTLAERLGEPPPTYRIVHAVISDLDPALLTLAREGTKVYTEAFDLIYRHEATGPNAVWQADHTELDIWLKDGRGQPEKPWLTIVLDDYNRAIAGYALSFSDQSAIQTALALRQAIWRKGRPGWQVCGIPGILYSDHGSDFTSRHLEQVAADLKIRLIHSTPNSVKENPVTFSQTLFSFSRAISRFPSATCHMEFGVLRSVEIMESP